MLKNILRSTDKERRSNTRRVEKKLPLPLRCKYSIRSDSSDGTRELCFCTDARASPQRRNKQLCITSKTPQMPMHRHKDATDARASPQRCNRCPCDTIKAQQTTVHSRKEAPQMPVRRLQRRATDAAKTRHRRPRVAAQTPARRCTDATDNCASPQRHRKCLCIAIKTQQTTVHCCKDATDARASPQRRNRHPRVAPKTRQTPVCHRKDATNGCIAAWTQQTTVCHTKDTTND